MNETRCLIDRLALFQKQKIEKNQLESKLLDEMNFACLSERIKFLKKILKFQELTFWKIYSWKKNFENPLFEM